MGGVVVVVVVGGVVVAAPIAALVVVAVCARAWGEDWVAAAASRLSPCVVALRAITH